MERQLSFLSLGRSDFGLADWSSHEADADYSQPTRYEFQSMPTPRVPNATGSGPLLWRGTTCFALLERQLSFLSLGRSDFGLTDWSSHEADADY
mgnify:CR=1 FL=1